MQDEVIYRCVNGACARPLPRRVNYCPYCGTSQSSGLPRPRDLVAGPAVSITKPAAPPPYVAPPPPPYVAPPPAAPVEPPRAAAPPPPRRGPEPAPPPQREPVRKRYWLLALAALWLIWITQRPSASLIDARIDSAIAMAAACKSGEAQAELIALRGSKATPQQLQRLQSALNDADAACGGKAARAKPARPLASQQAQSVRNLVADARQALAAGNYRAASEKMEVCVAMVDAGNRECNALKAKADRLQGEMERCLARGSEWVGDRCQ